jgi:hypothetical protein
MIILVGGPGNGDDYPSKALETALCELIEFAEKYTQGIKQIVGSAIHEQTVIPEACSHPHCWKNQAKKVAEFAMLTFFPYINDEQKTRLDVAMTALADAVDTLTPMLDKSIMDKMVEQRFAGQGMN